MMMGLSDNNVYILMNTKPMGFRMRDTPQIANFIDQFGLNDVFKLEGGGVLHRCI